MSGQKDVQQQIVEMNKAVISFSDRWDESKKVPEEFQKSITNLHSCTAAVKKKQEDLKENLRELVSAAESEANYFKELNSQSSEPQMKALKSNMTKAEKQKAQVRRMTACCLPGGVDASRRQQGGQVTGGDVQGEELRAYTLGVEVRTLQQKVLNSLRDIPAPGAVGVRGLMEAVQVNRVSGAQITVYQDVSSITQGCLQQEGNEIEEPELQEKEDLEKELVDVTSTITHKKEVLKDLQNQTNSSHQETSASMSRIRAEYSLYSKLFNIKWDHSMSDSHIKGCILLSCNTDHVNIKGVYDCNTKGELAGR
ncbi:hypothetical protein GWK47_048170 [Chionoecetes opilio]|uniref:Uncharacterized protein n=1 Tax=Chionoecetes opilio TaxID=41210 RepID=A0A8J4YC87_CHIOP|nr:hypothetical protein GWK47_048170 [Chionoecetes opilio]